MKNIVYWLNKVDEYAKKCNLSSEHRTLLGRMIFDKHENGSKEFPCSECDRDVALFLSKSLNEALLLYKGENVSICQSRAVGNVIWIMGYIVPEKDDENLLYCPACKLAIHHEYVRVCQNDK